MTGCLGVALVTLSTDTGRRQARAPCNLGPITFTGLAPGEYELLAEGEVEGRNLAAFLSVHLDSEREIGLPLRPLHDLTLRLTDGGGLAIRDVGISARRIDPAGAGPEQALTGERVQLVPGFWQITARPPATHYLSEVTVDAGGYRRTRKDPNPEWFEFYLDYSMRAGIALSSQPAQLSGRVTLGDKAAIAAPVYLLPTTPQTRRRINALRTTHTDVNGNYWFDGLAPGTYLVLSSLDITELNEETMSAAQAQSVTMEEGRSRSQVLELYRLPN